MAPCRGQCEESDPKSADSQTSCSVARTHGPAEARTAEEVSVGGGVGKFTAPPSAQQVAQSTHYVGQKCRKVLRCECLRGGGGVWPRRGRGFRPREERALCHSDLGRQ